MRNLVEIGKRIKYLRTAEGISQSELADQLFYANRQMISWYENGHRNIPLEVLIMYAERYDVSLDWLVFGSSRTDNEVKRTCLKVGNVEMEILYRLKLE